MDHASDLDVLKMFSRCNVELNARGLDLVEVTDFEAAEARAAEMGKRSVTPMLSASYNGLSRDDAFWLFLQKSGTDVGCVAARRDNLYKETLSEFWMRSHRRYYGLSGGEQSNTHAPAAVREIHGSVVYMGEFFLKKEARGSRNQLTLFTHALHSYCFAKWRPDWIYAFVRPEDVRRGYAAEYGFVHQVPVAQIWPEPPKGRQTGEYLVAISQRDLLHMASSYCRRPELLLSVDSLTRVEKLST